MGHSRHQRAEIGVIGLGVMGENLARNLEDRGFTVAVWNRDPEKTAEFSSEVGGQNFIRADTLGEFTEVLEPPRRILVMIKAGDPIDQLIQNLAPRLSAGDIVVDGGNSDFRDTRRREAELRGSGIRFFGVGVSGGEKGARYGPSLMPGGDPEGYETLRPILESIAAKTEYGPCVTWVGPDGAGHFVKTVHNGIEYGVMQVIAEAYDILRNALNLGARDIAGVFREWNKGPVESFLIDLTAKVLSVEDGETGRPLVDLVRDEAGQKGTGRWSAEAALDLGVSIPTIAAALDARVLSSMKEERVSASQVVRTAVEETTRVKEGDLVDAVRDALHSSVICAYAQGLNLIRAASQHYDWGVNLKEVARIWTGGCIIRAKLLGDLMRAYEEAPGLPSLFLDEKLNRELEVAQPGWRKALGAAQAMGIPVPAMGASLAHFDSYRTAGLPQNLTQAQRDAFGSHTYRRSDRPEEGFVHTDWLRLAGGGEESAHR
jgi:6-phosphogluconate dehydrogenase